MSLNPDLVAELGKRFRGDIRQDLASKILYSTDASIYQIEPAGVLIPRTAEDLQSAVELAARHRVSVVARGAGTSLAGQAIGPGLILDCSRWLDRILEIDSESQTATVEPGLVLADLNRAAARAGLQFGPDPASAERATMGGVVANNATGAHSVLYGMTADHLLSANVILSDGSAVELGPVNAVESPPPSTSGASRHVQIITAARRIRQQHSDDIKQRFPRTWRNSAGYRINYLLPWSPAAPAGWRGSDYPPTARDGQFNLAQLLAGSEGTLAVIRDLTIRLVPRPRHSVLGILSFDALTAACEAVPALLEHQPSAIELIPRVILRAAQRIPAYASRMHWFDGDPAALLVIEFAGDDQAQLIGHVRALGSKVQLAETQEQQDMIWATRKAGLGLQDSTPGRARPVSFIEDCAVPVERLAEFVGELERIMEAHGASGGVYGHASAGCVHARPLLDLKSGAGVSALRQIAHETLELTLRLGGAMSSEHGDGITRGEWLRQTYGDNLVEAMHSLKRAADPEGILNPGKMLDAPPMDTNLRYGTGYRALAWRPVMDLSRSGGLAAAIEQCNGQGVCRKDGGVMCPSFQATREEMYSTRGRANLLRAMISSGLPTYGGAKSDPLELLVFRALDLCLACKGCLAECPSGVDMAQLKAEFLQQHYRGRPRPLRDYLFGYFGRTAGMLALLSPFLALARRMPPVWQFTCRILGLSSKRPLPDFVRGRRETLPVDGPPSLLLLQDPFSHHVSTSVESAACKLLGAAGFRVRALSRVTSCAALISRGFLEAAQSEARGILDELRRLDPEGVLPLAVMEPPELEALRNDLPRLLPDLSQADLMRLERARSVEELLLESDALPAPGRGSASGCVLFHPHCHEKAGARLLPGGDSFAGIALLKRCGYDVELLDAGCCGMGGTFGFEAEHYELSLKIGARKLFPAIESARDALVAATGGACRMHISHGTGRAVEHPLVLAAGALGLD